MKTLKFKYLNVIQQNYGQGWEDASEYESKSNGSPLTMDLWKDAKEYRLMGYPTRIIFRKEKQH